MGQLTDFLQRLSDEMSLRKLIKLAILSRIFIIFAMAISCRIIPDHNPGDDVVHFDLREQEYDCFSMLGTFCHCGRSCQWDDGDGTTCFERGFRIPNNMLQRTIYPFLLRPLTPWDAARFLRLAHQPQLYTPHFDANCPNGTCPNPFQESEMAHVFFPLFPAIIQLFASLLLWIFPQSILPVRCEQVMVLSGMLVNILCFTLASVSLQQLTKTLLQNHGIDSVNARLWSFRVAILFICNPANVFFTALYSESLFAALVFSGLALLARRTLWQQITGLALMVLAVACRSNGIIYVGYLLLYGIGTILQMNLTFAGRISRLVGLVIAIAIMFMPLRRHNWRGIYLHCQSNNPSQPNWCDDSSPIISLYAYVQRKYWNVGFLRYYQLKQLPNFLLAAPILLLSFQGSGNWIYHSWSTYRNVQVKTSKPSILAWASFALRHSLSSQVKATSPSAILETGSQMLGQYAVLACAGIIGLTVAHVQISTRMICSTCPALYFYMATLLYNGNGGEHSKRGDAVVMYCALYTLLGIIMFPNYLPWT